MTDDQKLKNIETTLDWHIEDYLTCNDQTIRCITDAYNLGWFEAMETLKKKYFGDK